MLLCWRGEVLRKNITLQKNVHSTVFEEQVNKFQTVFCVEKEFGTQDISRCEELPKFIMLLASFQADLAGRMCCNSVSECNRSLTKVWELEQGPQRALSPFPDKWLC